MELCTGGSLFSILDDPINCLGLEESEFIAVLEHLGLYVHVLIDFVYLTSFIGSVSYSCWNEAPT